MSKGKISAKQREILDFIKSEILQRGYPPAVREICEAVQLKSTSSVHSHLETLEKNGYIRRDPTKPRAIEIMDDEFQSVRTGADFYNNSTAVEMVNIPIVGTVAAGQPILAQENIESYFPMPVNMVPNSFLTAIVFLSKNVILPKMEIWLLLLWKTLLQLRPSIKKTATIVYSRKMILWSRLL